MLLSRGMQVINYKRQEGMPSNRKQQFVIVIQDRLFLDLNEF